MRFTFKALKEFLDTSLSPKEIAEKLVELGLEVEEVIDRSSELKYFKVAKILETKKHPSADRLKVCKVETGSKILNIVCGAPNAREGLKVVLAPIGSIIPLNKMVIKFSKIRDEESEGMLCSESELMVGNGKDGIIELPETAIIGEDFTPYYNLDDVIFEVSITPNRGDCLGLYGIARDLAAKNCGILKEIVYEEVENSIKSPIEMENLESSDCPLFIGRYFKGVKNAPSPAWIQDYLRKINMEPISLLVDITNLISHLYGRPLHVYDADKMGNIIIRKAKDGENFKALNGKEYKLKTEDLVIASSEVQALAGIIGGDAASCSMDTTNIFLEAAVFDPVRVAKTGRRLQIHTESRHCFERKVDYNFTLTGAKIASFLINKYAGGEAAEFQVIGKPNNELRKITFTVEDVKNITNIEVTKEEIIQILERLKFELLEENSLTFNIPSWRSDISIKEDIAEEIARITGYEKIIMAPLKSVTSEKIMTKEQKNRSRAARIFAACDMKEAVTWSFASSKHAELFAPIKDKLFLQNPISQDLNYMRSSILINLVNIIVKNQSRSVFDLSLFEIGPVFDYTDSYKENTHLTWIRSGKICSKNLFNEDRLYDLFDIKADLFKLLSELEINVDNIKIQASAPSYYHPGKSGEILYEDKLLGYFGELHPKVLKSFDIKHPLFAGEIFIDIVSQIELSLKQSFKISVYPMVERDFAFVVKEEVEIQTISSVIKDINNIFLKDINIFDIYRGEKIEKGFKSVALNVTLQSYDHTLSENEIKSFNSDIINAVEKIGGRLRD